MKEVYPGKSFLLGTESPGGAGFPMERQQVASLNLLIKPQLHPQGRTFIISSNPNCIPNALFTDPLTVYFGDRAAM